MWGRTTSDKNPRRIKTGRERVHLNKLDCLGHAINAANHFQELKKEKVAESATMIDVLIVYDLAFILF
jgi:hypothetical protein